MVSSDKRAQPEATMEELYYALKRYTPAVRRDRRLQGASVDTITVRSPICGSQLTLDTVMENGRVKELGWKVRACALGQAVTAIIIEHLDELDHKTVQTVAAQLEATLKGEGRGCDWPELDVFAGAKEITSRHESAMLPFRALEQLFERARDF